MTHSLSLDDLIAWHRDQSEAAARIAAELEREAAEQRGTVKAHQAAIQELLARVQKAQQSALPEEEPTP